jgi:3-hydroxyisobutyrate dehydrogenase-like beta-hydroxyacid dehydrogenase
VTEPTGVVAESTTVVAILGLGEAGTHISRDLLARGVTVRGYDPVADIPSGVITTRSEAAACEGAALVLSLTTAHESEAAFTAALPGLGTDALYVDLNTSTPRLKVSIAEQAEARGISFADAAMMSPVPGRGIRTPMLVSGGAAPAVVHAVNDLGGNAELLPGPAGAAAGRKLIRSVFYKGMAAAVIEALQAARAAGCEDWLRDNIAGELIDADATTLNRLEQGSVVHAVRRTEEMGAATELLGDLGVPARVAAASRDWLVQLAADGHSRSEGGDGRIGPGV